MTHHPDFLRSPENVCKPDQRSADSAMLSGDSLRPRQLEDQHRAVAILILNEEVPEEIRIQFETTKNLYLYSWFVYRFYPIARHHAYTCLELALRKRFQAEMPAGRKQKLGPGLTELLAYAIENKFLRNENFEVWARQTRIHAETRTMYEAIEEMNSLGLDQMEYDENKIEIKDIDRDHDYLSVLLKAIPHLRNHFAHGSTSLHHQVLGTLQVVYEIINQIYPKGREAE